MTMADHSELVAEINYVEKLTPQERLKHAKKRRQQQLKKFGQYEKQLLKDQAKKQKAGLPISPHPRTQRVEFVNQVVLLEAASRNDVTEVKSLLERKVSPDVTNEDGLTALHQCCIDNSEEMLKVLLQYGANVNARDSELWTPLHAAATCGHTNLCKYLIDGGAELLAVNADGNMPYDICEDELSLDYIETEMAKKGVTQDEIDETRISTENQMLKDLKELLADGGNLEFTDRSNATALHIAAANGYIDVAEFLLENNVSVDPRDEDSWQPIHAAACWCEPEILELLVQHGADLDAKTKNGETPFDICEDPDLKQRILDMKDELETKAANKQREHDQMRRRSRNRRSWGSNTGSLYSSNNSLGERHSLSASIRRTSMREKTLLSLKEAREEAAHFGVVSQTPDEDEANENTPNGDDSKKLPSTNIDDIAVTLNSDEDTNNRDSPLTNGDSFHKEIPKLNGDSHHQHKDSHHHHGEPHPRNANASTMNVEVSNKEIPPSLPLKQSRTSSIQENTENNNKNIAQPPARSSFINGDTDAVNDNNYFYENKSLGRPGRPAPSPNTNQENDSEFSYPAPSNRPGGTPVRYPPGTPTGTLADLKKNRGEKASTLRLRDSANVDAHVQNMFLQTVAYSEHPRDGYNSLPRTKHDNRNGHNSPASRPFSTDRPLRRFVAPGNSPVIGGDEDQKTKCCIIM